VRLCLDFLGAPDLLSVDHEVSEFVCAVEAGTGAVVLVGALDHDRVVGERHPCLIERINKGDDDGVDAGVAAVCRLLSD
jgi:hypothetical protein